MEVNGIASLLDDLYATRVVGLWKLLESRCGLRGIHTELPPHFTWPVVDHYDMTRLEPALRAYVWAARNFTVRATGLGVFTGRNPVIYLHIIKDAALLHFHEQLWQWTQSAAIRPSPFYAPHSWTPHVTLAYGDVTRANLGCALETLAFEPFDWEIKVDNLALVCPKEGDSTPEVLRIPFGEINAAP